MSFLSQKPESLWFGLLVKQIINKQSYSPSTSIKEGQFLPERPSAGSQSHHRLGFGFVTWSRCPCQNVTGKLWNSSVKGRSQHEYTESGFSSFESSVLSNIQETWIEQQNRPSGPGLHGKTSIRAHTHRQAPTCSSYAASGYALGTRFLNTLVRTVSTCMCAALCALMTDDR